MRLPSAVFLLVLWLRSFSTSMFNDMSESMRFSADCELRFAPWIVVLMNSLMFLLTVCELSRTLCAKGWTESWTDDEIVGMFCWFDSIDVIRGSSFLLNLRTLLRMLFLKAFATRSPTARLYEGGGEYFGGASVFTLIAVGFDSGTMMGCDNAAAGWHKRLIGKCEIVGSVGSIGGLNKSSMRWGSKTFIKLSHQFGLIKNELTSRMSRGPLVKWM